MAHLLLIYGPPLAGKTSLARVVAGRLRGKAALVSTDALLGESIVVPDADVYAELEMVHTQARLMVANYLKNRYHVVLEGSFYYERGGRLHRYEQEIDQNMALMRNLAPAPLAVRLTASEATLRARAEESGRLDELATALRIEAEYKPRHGPSALHLETDSVPLAELAEQVVERLETVRIA